MSKSLIMFKKSFFLIMFFVFTFVYAEAQQEVENIDQKTYQLFQNKMYKKVIYVGEKAIKNGTDYFYLRNRIAISYFELKNYRLAIYHFEKAMKFNGDDPTTLEYLYYAYIFSGRNGDANLLISIFPDYLKEKINYKRKYLNSIYLEGGPSLSNNISKNGGLDIDGDTSIYGESDLNDKMIYFHLGLKHDLFSRLSIYHGFSNLAISKRKTIMNNNKDTTFDYTVKQMEYYINADFQLSKGLKITPALHLISVKADVTNASFDTVSFKYLYSNSSLNMSNYVMSLGLTKEYKKFSVNIFATYSNLNSQKQWQLGVSGTYFPFGNLDMYCNTTLALLNTKSKVITPGSGGNREFRLIYDQMLGAKIVSNLWLEASVSIGNLANYSEKNAFIVYNIADKINLKSGITAIYSLSNNFELSLRYQYLSRESSYMNFIDAINQQEILTNYQNNTIIGGIKWKL